MKMNKKKIVDFESTNGAGVMYTLDNGFVVSVVSNTLSKPEKVKILKARLAEY